MIGLAVENKYISRERNNSILERSEKICKDVLQIPWTTYTPNIKETGPFHRYFVIQSLNHVVAIEFIFSKFCHKIRRRLLYDADVGLSFLIGHF